MVLLASLLSFMVISIFELIWIQINVSFQFTFSAYSNFQSFSLHTGEGMGELSLADRATIANMSPEYGATMGFFPVDHVTLKYLKLTGRSEETVSVVL